MTLADLLETYWRHASERAPQAAAALDGEARALARSGRFAGALHAGDRLPDVVLPCAVPPASPGRAARLQGLAQDGPLVLVFVLGHWCPLCTLELRAWQRRLAELHALGARLVAVTPQDAHEAELMRERDGLQFPIVADPGNAIAGRFGIAYEVAPAMRDAYLSAGLTPPRGDAPADWTLPLPAVYVAGTDGRIVWAHVDPNWRHRAEPDEVVRRVGALAGR